MAIRPAAIPARNILSLCSGVGGLDLGVKLALNHLGIAGRDVVYVEGEAAAAASLVASMEAGWMDQAPIWSDMRTFDARPWRGIVDIVVSGDPCQDNSVAGKGAGADGERFLASEVTRIAEECRPDLIFRENVPGNADGQIEAIVPALEELGYRVAAGIFSSSETGNTMRRERLFIMAERMDGTPSARCDASRFGADTHGEGGECVPSSGCDELARASGERYVRPDGEVSTGRNPSFDAGRPMGGAISGSDSRKSHDAKRRSIERTSVVGPSGSGVEAMGSPQRDQQSQGVKRRFAATEGRENPRRQPALPSRAIFPPAVIPGPTSPQWRDVLDRWPELQPALSEEEAQSHLRRGVDAMAHRIERLRATGNGVDPMVAAYAFLSLGALLAEGK